jgi:hypothetical protein
MKTNYQMIISFKDFQPANRGWISGDESALIRKHFEITERTNVELQNLRDFIVIYYGMEVEKHHDKALEIMDKMSAITAIIDDEKWTRGLEV